MSLLLSCPLSGDVDVVTMKQLSRVLSKIQLVQNEKYEFLCKLTALCNREGLEVQRDQRG